MSSPNTKNMGIKFQKSIHGKEDTSFEFTGRLKLIVTQTHTITSFRYFTCMLVFFLFFKIYNIYNIYNIYVFI